MQETLTLTGSAKLKCAVNRRAKTLEGTKMNAISRSWTITKLTFSVIAQDKEMLLFPFFASIASILYVAAILIPSGVLQVFSESNPNDVGATWGAVEYAILFVVYLGLAFIATFFNVCVVYTTRTRFEGGDATFMESIRFGMSKMGIIFQWSLLAATVGLFLAMLERLAERLGGFGGIVVRIIRSVLGMVWSVLTIFVVPVLVYENATPKQAIRRSKDILMKTWGESLARSFGLGMVQFLCILAVIGITVGLTTLVPEGPGALFVVALGGICCLAVVLIFNVANTVFNTALYVYASTGTEPATFDAEVLVSAFKTDG
jgi:hypothetical protein